MKMGPFWWCVITVPQLPFVVVLLAAFRLFLVCSRLRRGHKERCGLADCQIIDYDRSVYIDLLANRMETVHLLEGYSLAGLARGECVQFWL